MSVNISTNPIIVSTAQTVALSQFVQVAASASNPAYLVVNAFDRAEYTASASGATGTLNGNGQHLGLTTTNGDARETGVVFTYQVATGRYFSSTVGYLDQLTYTASASKGDITDLSVFAFSSLQSANNYASDAYSLIQYDASGYLGSTTVATLPTFGNAVPAQATPGSIAAIADSFIGQAWNRDGCWTLTSTITAEAGASLPIQSTEDITGQANGEWFVAYNGPAGASGSWQSMVQTGDMIGFITSAGGGHITTCVAGSGSSAQLVDNETLVNQSGAVVNSANDGSSNDILIQGPHAASQEWAGVAASSVVIYRLDTPVVSTTTSAATFAAGSRNGLASLFSAADPAGKSVTGFQIYESNTNDALTVNGAGVTATSANNAASVASLANAYLTAGQNGGTDYVTIRATNGTYWGDWTTLSITNMAAPASVSAAGSSVAPSAVTATPAITSQSVASVPVGSSPVSVYRFFDTTDGTHFFTNSASERDSLIATRSDLSFEGVGMNAVSATANDPASESVYRFFDLSNGTHFYTASTSERDSLIASSSHLSYEGTAFHEDATQVAGDTPVYRFFDTVHGTHLFTQSSAENASILSSRSDLKAEGIAFYAPSLN